MTESKDLAAIPLKEAPATQSKLPTVKARKCPILWEENADNEGNMRKVILAALPEKGMSNTDIYNEKLCELTGTKNMDLAAEIIGKVSENICGYGKLADKMNVALQSLDDYQPRDQHEAKLCAQATALYSQGMDYLERARGVLSDIGTFDKHGWHITYMKSATKLLDLHTKTVDSLMRYRQKGEQRIIVQYVQVNDGGKAIVNGQMMTGGVDK